MISSPVTVRSPVTVKLRPTVASLLASSNINLLAGSRRGSPLAMGLSEESTYLGSDSLALAPFTQKIIFMDDENHKNTWNNFTKFVLWGTVAVIIVLVLMAIFLI